MKSPLIDKQEAMLFFGDATHGPEGFKDSKVVPYKDNKILTDYCEQFAQEHNLTHVVIVYQVHGVDGLVIKNDTLKKKITVGNQDGDFLITNQRSIALGVLTGDCLPVIVFDQVHHAVGIAHAGWRGTIASILPIMIQAMHNNYGTQPADLKLWFGPAAQSCCYEVQQDFVQATAHLAHQEQFLLRRDEKLFFDGTACNKSLLDLAGVSSESINREYNVCTICTPGYHSHRCKSLGRQISFVWLK